MVAHHGDQNFFGQFQILRIEAAANRRRELGQVDQRFEQRIDRACTPAPQSRFDLASRSSARTDHEVIAQRLFVIRDGDRDRLLAAEDAMSAWSVARAHAGDFERDDLIAQQRHDPADRPDERGRRPCRSSTSSSGK